ncbi:MAG: hypothetical protein A2W26_08520 [Acidobacteria bacterium RBG_16_64_8]|nr:MAG: hypothetical protein A2W26_08520 [Acidobacteria bacterium RBG_16_64_8]
MTEQGIHNRRSFEAQGTNFLKANIGESAFDYAANRPPHSYGLSGTVLTVALGTRAVRIRHQFSDTEVTWEMLDGPEKGHHGTAPYEAFELARGIFFVSFLARDSESVAMTADLGTGAVTVILGRIVEGDIVSEVLGGRIEGAGYVGTPPRHPPFSLGGTRFLNEYAHNVAYEHIYLTDVYETWLGVRGPQAGQADTEEYHSFKVADGVYIVYWNEKVLTAQMTFLFNFLDGECVGQVFAIVEGQRVHSTIGAHTHLIHSKLSELPNVTWLDVYTGGEA